MKSDKWDDYLSSFGGELTFRGGEFAESQYELDLRYVSTFSQPNYSSVTIRQLYLQTPLTDYTFLTVGKIEKKFGVAEFYNFSNRLSPKERVLGRLELLERQAPALVQIDWIASPYISCGTFLWSTNAQKWEEIHSGAQTEITLNNFYGAIYLYYERLKNWFVGINASTQLDFFRFYWEGIIKEKNEQYFSEVLKSNKINKKQLSFATGLAWEWKYYSTRCEFTFRTEGYSKKEQGAIRDLISISNDHLSYYNKGYFGKNYLGITMGTSRFIITNLGVNIANLISLDSIGGEFEVRTYYLHKEAVVFGINLVSYYGKQDNEYMLYLPYQYRFYGFVTFSY
jgi:hypothetical protein